VSQLFPRSADTALRVALAAGLALLIGVPLGALAFARTPLATGQYVPVPQPVRFSHPLHVGALRIDCRFCHAGSERAAMAGLPPTRSCVPCHHESWLATPAFAAIEHSLDTHRPVPWRRVTTLPDFVYFNHAVHVRKGVGCETCHGRVDLMEQVHQTAPLTMGWCLDCHRAPERQLRPVEQVTAMGWAPEGEPQAQGRALAARYHVRRLTTCTACHR